MTDVKNTKKPAFGSFLAAQTSICRQALATVRARELLRGVFLAVLVTAASLEGIRFGLIERPLGPGELDLVEDPVVASVGTQVLRVSDAFAHAAFVGEDDAQDMSSLIQTGTLDDAVDHLALAEMAREEGLADALEVRAAVALAERHILAEAFLERAANQAISEEAILQRYQEETRALAREGVMRLSQIVVPTKEAAESIRAKLPRTDFVMLARQRSIDEATASDGGAMGEVRAADLHPRLADAAAGLGLGGFSDPVETEAGWHILKLDGMRAVRLPPLEDRRDDIEDALRREALAEALAEARDRVPVDLRDPAAIEAEAETVAGTIALIRGQ
ncbi:MAG: peptidylprolyl isomerase [Parvularculaceae bacterium]|nr:peptidylprolyl isomerase [Parvularculaceae bacterium]